MKKTAFLTAILMLSCRAFAESEAGAAVQTAAVQTAAPGRSVFNVGAAPILIIAVVALIIALISVGSMKAQLKTARARTEASDYARAGSFALDVKQDRFLYQNVERRRVETPNGNPNSGAGRAPGRPPVGGAGRMPNRNR